MHLQGTLTRRLAALLGAAALAASAMAPTAFADATRPDDRAERPSPTAATTVVRPDDRPGPRGPGIIDPAPPLVLVRSGGFDWGDAGIGAGMTAGLVSLAAACFLSVRQRRARLVAT